MEKNNPQSFFLRLFMVAVAVMMAVGVWGQEVKASVYDQWHKLPMITLDKMADDFVTKSLQFDSAMVCLSIMANRYYEEKLEGHDLHIAVSAMNGLGQFYGVYLYDYPRSNSYLLMAEELAKQNGFDDILAFVYSNKANNLGAIITNGEIDANYDELIAEFKKVFYFGLKTGKTAVIDVSFTNIVNVAVWDNKLDSIEDVIHRFGEVSPRIPTKYEFAKSANKLYESLMLLKNNHLEEALKSLDELRTVNDGNLFERENITRILMSHGIKANILFRTGRYDEAVKEIREYERIARQHNDYESLIEVYRFYYRYYKKTNNQALADKNELEYLRLRDKMIKKAKLNGVEKTEFLFQLDKKNEEVKALAAKKKQQAYILYSVVAFTFLLALALLYIVYNYRETQKRNRQLYQRMQELLASEDENKRTLQAADQEKQRLLATIEELKCKETSAPPKPKYQKSTMDETSKDELLQKITAFMESSDDILLPSFSENALSEAIQVPVYRISQVINERRGCNFSTLLNEYRIKEACRRMSNVKEFGGLTIEGIGQGVGIMSRSYFVKTFKQFVGLTPSAYLKIAKQKAS